MKSATALAVLLMVVAAAAAYAAASNSIPFSEWLMDGKARPAYYGSEADIVHACLRTTAFEHCSTVDSTFECGTTCPASMGYFETKLGCCHSHDYDYDPPKKFFKDVDQREAGSCWWTVSYFDSLTPPGKREPPPAPAKTGSEVIGTFDVTCELKGRAEKCSDIFCDDMTLKGWGQIHAVYKAAIQGQPTAQGADSCALRSYPPDDAPIRKVADTSAAKAPAGSTDKAKVQEAGYYEAEVQYYEGSATVFFGLVNTYSCSHNLKVKEGRFLAVLEYDLDDVGATDLQPIVPSPGQFILKPFEILMKLKKTGSY